MYTRVLAYAREYNGTHGVVYGYKGAVVDFPYFIIDDTLICDFAGTIMPREYSFVSSGSDMINHRFDWKGIGFIVIILKSGSSVKRADGTPHNNEYNAGFERLIEVLSKAQFRLKVILDTRKTRKMGISEGKGSKISIYSAMDSSTEKTEIRFSGFCPENWSEDGAKGGITKNNYSVHPRYSSKEILRSIIEVVISSTLPKDGVNILPTGLPPNGETLFTRSSNPEGWLYIIKNPMWPDWIRVESLEICLNDYLVIILVHLMNEHILIMNFTPCMSLQKI